MAELCSLGSCSGSDEDETAKLYCKAITLAPDIVADDCSTQESPPKQNWNLSSFYEFFGTLKSTPATEGYARRIEETVEKHMKKKCKEDIKHKKGKNKRDTYQDEGIQSDFSTKEVGDTTEPPSPSGPPSGPPRASTGTGSCASNNFPALDLDVSDLSEAYSTSPLQDSNLPTPYVVAGQETEPIRNGHKIGCSTEASDQPEHSNSSVPVYPTHNQPRSVMMNRIHHATKTEVGEVIADKDDKIDDLVRQLEEMEIEKTHETEKHKQEIEEKERDLEEIERKKQQELDSLKTEYGKKVEDLEKQHKKTVTDIQNALGQKIGELQQLLDETKSEKAALEQQKIKAEEDVITLKLQYEKCLEDEKRKHENEVEELRLEHRKEIGKLEELLEKKKKKLKAEEERLQAVHMCAIAQLESKHKDDLAALKDEIYRLKDELHRLEREKVDAEHKLEIQDIQMDAKENKANAQIEIHKARSETLLAQKQVEVYEQVNKKLQVSMSLYKSLSSTSWCSSGGSTQEELTKIFEWSFSRAPSSSSTGNFSIGDDDNQANEDQEI